MKPWTFGLSFLIAAAAWLPSADAQPIREVEAPESVEITLAGGSTLLHHRLDSSPMTYVAAVADGGWDNAEPGKEGIFEMAADMAWRGAGDRDGAAFAKAATDIGAEIGYSAEPRATAITLSVSAENLAAGSALLADAVLRPRFDPDAWDAAVAARLDTIARDETKLDRLSWNAAMDWLLPPTPEDPRVNWSAEAVEDMSLEEVKAVYARLFQPSSTRFVSVGPMPAEEVAAALDAAFAGWADAEPGFERKPRRPTIWEDAIVYLFVPEPGASRTSIDVLRPAPGLLEDGRAESIAVARLLASRLGSAIRGGKGHSHAIGGGLLDTIDHGSALHASATVEGDATVASVVAFFNGFASLRATPPTAEELDRTFTAYRSALARTAETGAGLFATILSDDGVGISLEDHFARHRAMTGLDLDAVREQALAIEPLKPGLFVIAGDPDTVLPQLEEVGIFPDVLERPGRRRDASDPGVPPGDTAPGDHAAGRSSGVCEDRTHCPASH